MNNNRIDIETDNNDAVIKVIGVGGGGNNAVNTNNFYKIGRAHV